MAAPPLQSGTTSRGGDWTVILNGATGVAGYDLDVAGTQRDPLGELGERVVQCVAEHPGWDADQISAYLAAPLHDVLDAIERLVDRGILGVDA